MVGLKYDPQAGDVVIHEWLKSDYGRIEIIFMILYFIILYKAALKSDYGRIEMFPANLP